MDNIRVFNADILKDPTMKNSLFRCITVATVLALSGPSFADSMKPITTEADFRAQVVGKKLMFGDDYVTARANGKVVGNFGGKALNGAWAWRDQFWCRTLTTHAKNTDCQAWETDGKTYRVTRQRGQGKSFDYTLK